MTGRKGQVRCAFAELLRKSSMMVLPAIIVPSGGEIDQSREVTRKVGEGSSFQIAAGHLNFCGFGFALRVRPAFLAVFSVLHDLDCRPFIGYNFLSKRPQSSCPVKKRPHDT
jgi:hypothetical protein